MFSFPPALAVASVLEKNKQRPFLLVHPNCLQDFSHISSTGDVNLADCVVLGDAVDGFSYENMNKAFKVLMNNENGQLFSLRIFLLSKSLLKVTLYWRNENIPYRMFFFPILVASLVAQERLKCMRL